MGFSDSFDEAFNKTAPVATAGAFDIMKEKIKDAQVKADEAHKTESVRNAIIASAVATGDPNKVKQYSAIADSMKGSGALPGLKLVHQDLQARIKADQDQAKADAKQAKDTAEVQAIGDSIISGQAPPDLTRLYGKAGPVKAYLANQDFDLTKATNDWTSTQALAKSLNGPQQLRLTQALTSVQNSIPELQKVSQGFTRAGWVPSNKGELMAAMSGTDPSKRDVATKYVTQINLMKDELAQSFQGGGVPRDGAFKLADEILNPAYGVKQLDSGIKQLQTNLNIRRNAIVQSQPNFVGGNTSSEDGQYEYKTVNGVQMRRKING